MYKLNPMTLSHGVLSRVAPKSLPVFLAVHQLLLKHPRVSNPPQIVGNHALLHRPLFVGTNAGTTCLRAWDLSTVVCTCSVLVDARRRKKFFKINNPDVKSILRCSAMSI